MSNFPADWCCHTKVLAAGNGMVERCVCLRKVDYGYHPFVVHTACKQNGEWVYECGDYFREERYSDAVERMMERGERLY